MQIAGQVTEACAPEMLENEWRRCATQDPVVLKRWHAEGGEWIWQPSGVGLCRADREWVSYAWEACGAAMLAASQNFSIEITVSGKANAAGISFGPYKDFLTPVAPDSGKRRLQLEVDNGAGTWAFRVDGRLMPRSWWDSSVRGTEDIMNGVLTLKARRAEQALFEDFRVHAFTSSCRVSVIMTCHRFQQRLRVSLRNWCQQNLPSGAFEVLVVNPGSPDGTHEMMAAVARSFSNVRLRELAVPHDISKNKGKMINHAIRQSRGEWIWLTDADCLFPPNAVEHVLQVVGNRTPKMYYGQRRYLSTEQTDALLSGRLDSIDDFAELSTLADQRHPENAPWGYTQIAHRSVWNRIPYTEQVNHFAHSDEVLIRECHRQRIKLEQIAGLYCLHLDHPFSWYGTDAYL